MTIEKWINKIKATDDFDKLNAIIEKMAFDEEITNEEYAKAYEIAVNKFRRVD